jgi:hypothetical protein
MESWSKTSTHPLAASSALVDIVCNQEMTVSSHTPMHFSACELSAHDRAAPIWAHT